MARRDRDSVRSAGEAPSAGQDAGPGGKGGITFSRRTHRPRTIADPRETLARRLSAAEFRERAQFTEDELEILDACCSHRPPRNALAILNALKFRAEFAYPKPKQEVEHSGQVQITEIKRVVVDPAKP